MVSYILITKYSILLFMNPTNFKFLLTACRSELCQRFLNKEKRLENKNNVKNVKNVTKIKKNVKDVFYIYGCNRPYSAGAEYCGERVCLSVCLYMFVSVFACISLELHVQWIAR